MSDEKLLIERAVEEHVKAVQGLSQDLIYEFALMIRGTIDSGGKIYICGNGGSAADAQHFATELVCKFYLHRRPLGAIALTTDSSMLTAIANDFGHQHVFARQLDALASPKDLLIGISTSGASQNILNAIKMANRIGMMSVMLTSIRANPNPRDELERPTMWVPVRSSDTARIQELHELILHVTCALLDKWYFVKEEPGDEDDIPF